MMQCDAMLCDAMHRVEDLLVMLVTFMIACVQLCTQFCSMNRNKNKKAATKKGNWLTKVQLVKGSKEQSQCRRAPEPARFALVTTSEVRTDDHSEDIREKKNRSFVTMQDQEIKEKK